MKRLILLFGILFAFVGISSGKHITKEDVFRELDAELAYCKDFFKLPRNSNLKRVEKALVKHYNLPKDSDLQDIMEHRIKIGELKKREVEKDRKMFIRVFNLYPETPWRAIRRLVLEEYEVWKKKQKRALR